jgi:hypothetical protein
VVEGSVSPVGDDAELVLGSTFGLATAARRYCTRIGLGIATMVASLILAINGTLIAILDLPNDQVIYSAYMVSKPKAQ